MKNSLSHLSSMDDPLSRSTSRPPYAKWVGVCVLLYLVLPGEAFGQVITNSQSSGTLNWSDPAAWNGVTPPGAANTAQYNLGGTTTTVVDGAITILGLDVTSSSGTKNITLGSNVLSVGTLDKAGDSTLSIRGQSGTFSGTTVNVTAGTLRFGNPGATANLTINSLTVNGKTTISSGATMELNVNTFSSTSNRGTFAELENNGTVRILTNSASAAVGGANVTRLTGGGTTEVNSTDSIATGTLHINGSSGTSTYSGILRNGAASNTLVLQKSGNSTQTLSGANTYSGGTTVTEGLLIGDHNTAFGTGSVQANGGVTRIAGSRTINNAITINGGELNVRGTASGAVTFGASGGRLSGDGSVSSSLTLNQTNQILAPGNSTGVLAFGSSQSWSALTYEWELNSWSVTAAAGSNYDQVSITGELDFSLASENSIRLELVSLLGDNTPGNVPGFAEANRQWTIISTSGGITEFNASHWDLVTTGFTSSPAWSGSWTVSASSNQIFLNYVIPEPSSALLLGAGLMCLLARRRVLRPKNR